MNEISTLEKLPLMEAFYTLQGEGYHQGKAAYFIRLGGCDVGCVWCDVKESWDAAKHPLVSIDKIVNNALVFPSKIAVITGGEPLLHDLNKLTESLHHAGFQTHIETSGSSSISGSWDWICLSPKKFKAPIPQIIAEAHELKIVVYNQSDFDWATSFQKDVSKTCKLFLQPEWSRAEKVTPLIVEYIKQHPEWELSLQVHKYIQVP